MNANARKFYVSQSGSDSYTSTQAQSTSTPWQTLSKVQSNVTNGDSVLFAKGSKFSGTLTLNSKSNVYFGTYGTGADPLFWGTGSKITGLITLNTCTNITFYGWNISDTTISFTDRTVQAKIEYVFLMYSTSTGNTIRKCRMDRMGYGAYITPQSNGNTMDSCDIGNLRMIRNTPGGDDDYGGVPIQLSSRNNIVSNNYFHDCYAVSFDYGFDGGGVEFFEEGDSVKGNIIKYNTFIDCEGLFEFGSNNDGVANNPHSDNVIAYNKFINNNTVVYINNNGQYKTKVTNLQFYNNVVVQTLPNKNPAGSSGIQFSMATDDATAGIIVLKNNILQVSNGSPLTRSGQFAGSNLTHTNNIYKLSNGSITNFTLGVTEISTSGNIWVSTTDANPINWNYFLINTSQAINTGVNIGITRDFNNQVVSNPPDMGILEYSSGNTPVACTSWVYSPWTACVNNFQTRTVVGSPAGCIGTPDSALSRSCGSCVFVYSAWSGCVNGGQTRTYTATSACTVAPPVDSLQRTCNVTCTSFSYGTWSSCINGIQTRNYSAIPIGCNVGNPPADSLSRICTIPDITVTVTNVRRTTCLNKSDGKIVISISGGVGPYSTSINSTIIYVDGKTSFNGLFPGTYIIRVRDSRGIERAIAVTVESRRNKRC
jgi:hypothetical protein